MADVQITVAVEGGDAAKQQLAGIASATEAVTAANKTQQALDESRAYTSSLNAIAQQKRIDSDYAEALQIDALRDHTQALIQAYNEAQGAASGAGAGLSAALDKITLNSQYARREMMMLGREIVSGDLARAPMTLSSLVFHSNALSLLMKPISLGIIAVGAAIGTMITAAVQGAKEVEAMNLALAATSGFAGMTRSAMADMAEQVSRNSELTIGVSKELVTQIVASGRYSAENVAALAGMVDDYAVVTGMSAAKAGEALVKMFEDPAKASETLNEKYHYLSVAELDRIKTLEATGQIQEAVALALAKFDEHIGGYSQNVGFFAKAWDEAKKGLSGFWDSLKGIGQDKTLDQRIADLQSTIAKSGGILGGGNVMNQSDLAEKRALLEALQQQRRFEADIAELKGENVRQATLELAAHKEAEKSQLAQIQNVKNQIELVKSEPDPTLRAQRTYELTKQLGVLQAGIGADRRAVATDAESAATKLWGIQSKSDIDALNAKLKIHEISKFQHDTEVLAIDLETIKRKAADEQAILNRGNLTALQKQQHEEALARYAAEATARQAAYDNSLLVDANALLVKQAEVSTKSTEAIVVGQEKVNLSLQTQIDKQKLHNEEIGKTKSQVESLQAAELNRQIAAVQFDIDTARQDEIIVGSADNYIGRLETTKARLLELQQLQLLGSFLQEAADTKKQETAQEDIRIARDVSLTLQDQRDRLLALRDAYLEQGKSVTMMRDVGKAINEVDKQLVEHQQKVWGLGFTWKGVSDAIDATVMQARTSVATNLSAMLKGHEDFRTAVQNIWHGLGNFIVDEMAKLVVSEAFAGLKSWFGGMFKGMFSGVGETIWASIKPIASPIMDMFSGIFKSVGQTIWDFLSPAFTALSSMFGGLLSGVIKGLAEGMASSAAAGGGFSSVVDLAIKGWNMFSGGTSAGAVNDLTSSGGGFVTAADAAQLSATTQGTGYIASDTAGYGAEGAASTSYAAYLPAVVSASQGEYKKAAGQAAFTYAGAAIGGMFGMPMVGAVVGSFVGGLIMGDSGGREKASDIRLYKDPNTGGFALDVGNISDAGPSQAAFAEGPGAALTAEINDPTRYNANKINSMLSSIGFGTTVGLDLGFGVPVDSATALAQLVQVLTPAANFATGGEMLVTRPTLIRTGEVGPERVSVSPLTGAVHGQGGGNITNNFNGPFISDAYGMKLFLKGQQRLLQRGGF